MYVEIVPIVRLIRKLRYFDYKVPSELEGKFKIGQIVEIEFRKKKINGVVQKIKEQTGAPEKEVKNILNILPIPELTKNQLDLVSWMSDRYLLSPALVFKAILPHIPKRLKSQECKKNKIDLKIKPNKEANQILKSKNKRFLLHYNSEQKKNKTYLGLILNFIKKEKQIIIAVPELNDLKNIKEYLRKYFDEDLITELHSGLAKGKYFKNWLKIREGQAKIIIGTRYSVFAPVSNLGLIILDKEHDDSHKQWDQNPRYHDRDIAGKLSELTGCKVLLSSSSPSIDVYHEFFDLIESNDKANTSEIKIIDQRDELRKGNYSVFSEYLQNTVTKILSENKKVFLLINKRGSARAVVCRDCGYIAKCPKCNLALTFYTNYSLICHQCRHQEKLKSRCPKCSGLRFKYVGAGTQKIETELRKLVPTARTIRIDSDVKIDKTTEQQIYSGDYQIIIGTKLALKYLDWSSLGLIGIISADILLSIPDFRSLEKVYQLINNLAVNLNQDAELVVQTRNPDNYAIRSAVNGEYKSFFEKEIKQRKELSYPPFSKIVKLSFRDFNQKKSTDTAKGLLRLLNNENKLNIAISGPFTKKTGKFYTSFFILKIPNDLFEKSYKLLETIPDTWTIDINPESLL